MQPTTRRGTLGITWLFNPGASHGLGSSFLAAFLQAVAVKAAATPANKFLRLHLTKEKAFETAEILPEYKGAGPPPALQAASPDAAFLRAARRYWHFG